MGGDGMRRRDRVNHWIVIVLQKPQNVKYSLLESRIFSQIPGKTAEKREKKRENGKSSLLKQ